jgi:phenylacetic acid degradation operon negative regulatory protein
MSVATATQSLIDEFRSRPTLRAGSLITTVFGDAIAPRGGTVWLGSLIRVMQHFGISERLVRTSVFRLSRDDWLGVNRAGRRSYYSLTDYGSRRFEVATRRIYSKPARSWSGEWALIVIADADTDARELLHKEASWLGFASLSNGVLAHPSPDVAELEAMLRRVGIDDEVVLLSGKALGENRISAMRLLVRKKWDLRDIDRRYGEFVDRFRPVYQAVSRSKRLDDANAFRIRTMLIHEYRKVMLWDPLLPADLLPRDWHGSAAYQLCRNLYLAVHATADAYVTAEMETADGPLAPPQPDFYERFGGLEKDGP